MTNNTVSKSIDRLWRTLLWSCLSCVCALPALARNTADTPINEMKLKMGTVWQNSSAFPGYVGYRNVIVKNIPGLRLAVVEIGGAVITEDAVVAGEVDMGNSDSPDLYMKYHALGRYQGEPKATMLRALWVNQQQPNTVFVLEASGVKSVQDLHDKPYGVLIGSIVGDTFKDIMADNGIKPRYYQGEPSSLADAVANMRLIGYAKGGEREASIREIALTMPIRVLPVPENMLTRTFGKYRGFRTAIIPAGSYEGQKQDVPTWTSASFIVGTDKLPEELVYRMIKAVYENRKEVLQAVPSWNLLDNMPQNIVDYGSIPLHPGTVRFLREQGITVPDYLMPPEMLKKAN